jgi:hypothetical protein
MNVVDLRSGWQLGGLSFIELLMMKMLLAEKNCVDQRMHILTTSKNILNNKKTSKPENIMKFQMPVSVLKNPVNTLQNVM